MNKKWLLVAAIVASFIGGVLVSKLNFENSVNEVAKLSEEVEDTITDIPEKTMENSKIKLGAFSVSLSVKNLQESKVFYEKMGFVANGGGMEMNYLIMKNGNAIVGLFQGMFDGNILTFNPGWDENAQNIEEFDDVRQIQKELKENNVELMTEAPDTTTGPASIMFADPDGNMILIDQHR